ncbi:hypothetical protein EX30DRAFT_369323 [Ascodesmis nigricans]|uniref:NEDD8-activating enzyme E1 regulatory subunit n=1 Tax=Ascodesmis nigricans TaxID=341454 RepID=A0A4S2N4D2_9PEZI|nr:hypothetical protein EX30DRAFT_369323 [Ascodesmis nigricans]
MASIPPSGVPSSKEKKYDRQLRLWGANGQNRLEAAHIALVGATSTGCEILKNLVLPCVGEFTIIDDKTVEESDLGTNFFLDEASIGKSRAERTMALLAELNPDVKGNFINNNLHELLETQPELFDPSTTKFTHIVVVSPFLTSDLLRLPQSIPLCLVYSVGFVTSFRLALPTHCIVETHPDSLVDLRLLSPWPELLEYATKQSAGLDAPESEGGMSDHQHGHVPYVVLLLKYLEDWKQTHNGSHPISYKEKNEFKAFIQSHMRTNVPGGSEENYEEAVAAVLKHIREPELSSATKAIFADARCAEPPANGDSFWITANAVSQFYSSPSQGAGVLPLSGSFPDMKAESSVYVELQNLYRARAQRDASLVFANVQATLDRLSLPTDSITLDDVTNFCKHANFLKHIDYCPLSDAFSEKPAEGFKDAVKAAWENWDAEDGLVYDYVALRGWQMFLDTHGKPPGVEDDSVENDRDEVSSNAQAFLKSVGIEDTISGTRTEKVVKELVRAGGGELHVIAALVGGIAAQELVKIITKQYIPVNNTVMFDGGSSRSAVFQF